MGTITPTATRVTTAGRGPGPLTFALRHDDESEYRDNPGQERDAHESLQWWPTYTSESSSGSKTMPA